MEDKDRNKLLAEMKKSGGGEVALLMEFYALFERIEKTLKEISRTLEKMEI